MISILGWPTFAKTAGPPPSSQQSCDTASSFWLATFPLFCRFHSCSRVPWPGEKDYREPQLSSIGFDLCCDHQGKLCFCPFNSFLPMMSNYLLMGEHRLIINIFHWFYQRGIIFQDSSSDQQTNFFSICMQARLRGLKIKQCVFTFSKNLWFFFLPPGLSSPCVPQLRLGTQDWDTWGVGGRMGWRSCWGLQLHDEGARGRQLWTETESQELG